MRITALDFKNIKNFEGTHRVTLNPETKMFAFAGGNGAGKSTVLKLPWLIQKAHFISTDVRTLTQPIEDVYPGFTSEVRRYLTSADSYARLELDIDGTVALITIKPDGDKYLIEHSDYALTITRWDIQSPNYLILHIDASKGFSEDTLRFDDLTIAENDKRSILLQAILNPGQIFTGIYQQLVKDYVHDRVLPSKPDRLIYYHVGSKIFTKLLPHVELKKFSGNYRPGEFVLLGKAGKKVKHLYDVREFSSGEKALLSTLTFLCISRTVIALVIDEPENHFHESLLLELMTVLHSLTNRGGIANWIDNNPAVGKRIKREWIQNEYKDHNLEQVLVATHSKSLIYKFFSLGKNFTVADGITEIRYEDAEGELRHLGLSTIYSKVLLVEGDGDHHALEFVFKGENIKVMPLHGSSAVLETFRRLAQIRQHVTDARFVFLVDSDNKPTSFFSKLEATNKKFYDESFVVLDVHEFENLFLDAALFELVIKRYLSIAGNEAKCPSLMDIQAKLTGFARKTLERVYKKELSLAFQQEIERHFAQAIWGNKSFRWDTPTEVNTDLGTHITAHTGPTLNTALMAIATQTYATYHSMTETTLLARCDGKQALAEACHYFSSIAGAKYDAFREALLKAGVHLTGSKPASVVADLLKRMHA